MTTILLSPSLWTVKLSSLLYARTLATSKRLSAHARVPTTFTKLHSNFEVAPLNRCICLATFVEGTGCQMWTETAGRGVTIKVVLVVAVQSRAHVVFALKRLHAMIAISGLILWLRVAILRIEALVGRVVAVV